MVCSDIRGFIKVSFPQIRVFLYSTSAEGGAGQDRRKIYEFAELDPESGLDITERRRRAGCIYEQVIAALL